MSPRFACSSSASRKSFRMLASDSPTYLFKISGPFTTFGSRVDNSLPILRAIKVLPHPGGLWYRLCKVEVNVDQKSASYRPKNYQSHEILNNTQRQISDLYIKYPSCTFEGHLNLTILPWKMLVLFQSLISNLHDLLMMGLFYLNHTQYIRRL